MVITRAMVREAASWLDKNFDSWAYLVPVDDRLDMYSSLTHGRGCVAAHLADKLSLGSGEEFLVLESVPDNVIEAMGFSGLLDENLRMYWIDEIVKRTQQ